MTRIFATLTAAAAVALLWVLLWDAHAAGVKREYEINRTGQAMQAGQIAHARALEEGITTSDGRRMTWTLAAQFAVIWLSGLFLGWQVGRR